ncbi:mitogen-activated protein kinase kinase kinase 5 isoform X2 [Ziziphus jujuba]|uniref:mitogen-activated protein kinase kinase kinase n=1 Tax=Ziziphus jujuba TaxID=326968 RepID=A0A6P4AMK7_ZIZJJ|nr:mitogen-activated protein kinase kinase kinase 5 isoform X2 [Ziziphus jujuba]
MRWLPSISFLSSSSSSTASPSSSSAFRSTSCGTGSSDSRQKKPATSSPNGNLRGGSFCSRRKLTRQRKLRHFAGDNVSGIARWSDSHSLDSPEGLRRWSTSCEYLPNASSSTSSAVPQPLPLPEFSSVFRRKDNSGDGDCRLPSPKSAPGRGVEDRDRDRAEGIGEGVSANTRIRSVFASQDTRTQGHAEIRPSRKGYNNDQSGFRIEIPIKSAPTSPLSSPGLSPRRQSVGDVLTYHYVVPQGNQVWSAPEMPTGDIIGGHHPPFFDYTVFSNDSSPLNSPQGRSTCQNPRSPGSTSPLHSKLSFETSTPRREGSASLEVHPLPLPPGAVISSPTVPIPQVTAKPESLPLKSQWQKGKLIGRGTFGSVYVASNRETGALCAMKEVEMLPDDPKSAECIKQLEQEIKVLSQLKHPNIVQYYGSEIIEDRFYIYLEYVHPGSINKYVREHCGAITESVVRNFTRHILSGLAYLHSTKTIHRDIKGANLLVDSSGVVKLADFGMAKHLTGQVSNLSLKGSPYWMAPELMQAVMQKDTSSDLALAVDIWSLGCTIIEMFTGKPPWNEYEGAAAMFKVMKDTPAIPETLSPEGKDFLRCCFQRNPAERPTAAKLLEHRFLKNSLLDVPSFPPLLNGMKLPSESKLDQSPVSLSTPISRGKVTTFDSETGQQSHPDANDLAVACRLSPRSILEALPGLSPPRSAQNTHHPSSSAYVASCVIDGVKKNRIFR